MICRIRQISRNSSGGSHRHWNASGPGSTHLQHPHWLPLRISRKRRFRPRRRDAPGTDGAAPAARDTVARPSEQTIAANRRLQARVLTLQTELEDSRAANAKLSEALKTAQEHAAMPHSRGQADEKIEKMTRQLDVQGLELQRMRKSTVQLREHLRVLHEAAAAQMAEPQMINKAMMAELESLRATRHSETAEMDEILAELMPLIEEARSNG